MKKFIAILLLSLMCLTTLPGELKVSDAGYALIQDCEDPEAEGKEGKKESKEFTLHTYKKPLASPSLIFGYNVHQPRIYPRPALTKQTPPPDPAC